MIQLNFEAEFKTEVVIYVTCNYFELYEIQHVSKRRALKLYSMWFSFEAQVLEAQIITDIYT